MALLIGRRTLTNTPNLHGTPLIMFTSVRFVHIYKLLHTHLSQSVQRTCTSLYFCACLAFVVSFLLPSLSVFAALLCLESRIAFVFDEHKREQGAARLAQWDYPPTSN